MYSEKEIKTARVIVFGSSAFAFVALLLVAYLVSYGVV